MLNYNKIADTVISPLQEKSCQKATLATLIYSTVTDFARFLGLSTSNPFSFEI